MTEKQSGTSTAIALATSRLQDPTFCRPLPKVVVAFAGARDAYQVPLALADAQLLECLVTDRYFPSWLSALLHIVDRGELVSGRLPVSKVRLSAPALQHFIAEKLGRQSAGGWKKGTAIGKAAHDHARGKDVAIFSYSTYAFEAFKDSEARYKFLFQFHPHPRSVRKILLEELERMPWTASSLLSEPELALSEEKFELLCRESDMADGIVVASRFTAETLVENFIAPDRIHVVPYGVDPDIFCAEPHDRREGQFLRIAFVGSLDQRKGASYLFEALRLVNPKFARLVICSRSRPRSLWRGKLPANCELHIGLSRTKMIRVLSSCDLLVLPSLIEGFGLVILEAMSMGLPVVATSHTGAPNVISDGHDGFIIPIRDSQGITAKLEWALENPGQLREMGANARAKAREFSWERFRSGIRTAYRQMIADRDSDYGD